MGYLNRNCPSSLTTRGVGGGGNTMAVGGVISRRMMKTPIVGS